MKLSKKDRQAFLWVADCLDRMVASEGPSQNKEQLADDLRDIAKNHE